MRGKAAVAAIVLATTIFGGIADASAATKRARKAQAGPSRPDPALAPAVPGEFLIRFTSSTTTNERAASVKRQGGKTKDHLGVYETVLVEFDDVKANKKSAKDKMREFKSQEKGVMAIEPNYLYTASLTPNDPSLSQQYAWGLIGAPAAWDTTLGSSATRIAVIDTGVARTHPDLDAKIVPGFDYVQNDSAPDDGNGHGTHVAGSAAAETGNATGGAGMCPSCAIQPIRVLDNSGSGTLANVAKGITYAADAGAKVINLSLGGPGSSTLQQAVDYAWNKGSFLACAAGNNNTSSTTSASPGAYANCFAVAATTSSDARASYSNYGTWVEIAAPGSSIYSTWLNSGYNTISGTSMAAPHVAGLAGLLSSQGLNNWSIRDRLCSTAAKITGTGTLWSCGRIDAAVAVGASPSPSPTPTPAPTALTNGGFESGLTPWSQTSSSGYSVRDSSKPHSGSWGTWFLGYNNGTDTISQLVTVPSNGTLGYWWQMTSGEGTTTAYDYLRVRVLNQAGTLLGTLRTWSNVNARNVWSQDKVSLAAYAGQTVRIQFEGRSDSSLVSSFFVDDVSLTAP